jgi:hypothetical protein
LLALVYAELRRLAGSMAQSWLRNELGMVNK